MSLTIILKNNLIKNILLINIIFILINVILIFENVFLFRWESLVMNIEKAIKDSLINFDGKVAVYYDDLNGNILKINEKEKYNSASCIKIFILVELFNQISKGLIDRKKELTYLNKHDVNGSGVMQYLSKGIKLPILDIATLMMIISDNVATNMLIDFLGIEKINKAIENIGCKDTKLYSEFKSVEDEIFSETTAFDYYLVWKKLNNCELFDKNITQEIIDIIKNQKYHEMVGDGIDEVYKEVENPIINYIVTKSGKYQSVRNDGGIVSTIFGNYILIIFIKDFKDKDYRNDEYVFSQGKKISNIVFNEFIRKRNI